MKMAEVNEVAARAIGGETRVFGPDCLIPSAFDRRLILRIEPALARAAEESGIASRPIANHDACLDRVLRAAQVLKEEYIGRAILVGRPQVMDTRLKRYG